MDPTSIRVARVPGVDPSVVVAFLLFPATLWAVLVMGYLLLRDSKPLNFVLSNRCSPLPGKSNEGPLLERGSNNP